MLGGEDYVVVWVGSYHRLGGSALQHERLVASAARGKLQTWHDTFEVDAVTGPIECLLIGRLIEVLGVKENRFRLDLSPGRLNRVLDAVRGGFARMRLQREPRLLVLLHVEDPEP